jgi:CDP-diacylglycerol--glycerol-3-phosphate 3-phosphatidyltransferase
MILPNQLTTLRIILTPVFLVLFLSEAPLLRQISLIVYIIAAFTDWYDGWLARKFNYITAWGKFMDPLADKILTSTAFFAFAATGIIELWMVIIIVSRDLIITGLRMFADYQNKSFRTSKLAQWKTMLQMLFIFYLLIVFTLETVEYLKQNYTEIFSFLTNRDLIYFSMLLITLFTLITGIIYLLQNRKLIIRLFVQNDPSN